MKSVSLASQKHVRVMYNPLNHTFIQQNLRMPTFLIFAAKHRLWVLVRTEAVLTRTYLCFEQKIRKILKKNLLKIYNFKS